MPRTHRKRPAVTQHDLTETQAIDIIEKLRSGIPPRRYASRFSAGLDTFITNVRRRHLTPEPGGKIRFVSGSWGSGKTHFFRLLAEQAFDTGYLVSTVELTKNEAPFNKFELVLAAILRNVTAAESEPGRPAELPLADFLRGAIQREQDEHNLDAPEAVERLTERLFADPHIDIDVKRVVRAYWATYTASDADAPVLEERRGFLLQWFTGEAHKTQIRKEFDVQKTLSKENARLFLGSLVALSQFLGYRGLVVLFDESEMSHSTMRRSDLQQAHNNLLHLINEIGEIQGLLLIYAAVPEFFTDSKSGIGAYGALSARIGRPEDKPPVALDKIWNLDAVEFTPDHFAEAARRIRDIYLVAYPEDVDNLLSADQLESIVLYVVSQHGPYERISRWRAVVTSCVSELDRSLEGQPPRSPQASYESTRSVLDRLGDDD